MLNTGQQKLLSLVSGFRSREEDQPARHGRIRVPPAVAPAQMKGATNGVGRFRGIECQTRYAYGEPADRLLWELILELPEQDARPAVAPLDQSLRAAEIGSCVTCHLLRMMSQ